MHYFPEPVRLTHHRALCPTVRYPPPGKNREGTEAQNKNHFLAKGEKRKRCAGKKMLRLFDACLFAAFSLLLQIFRLPLSQFRGE
ncbi:hypothetical protein POVWA2_016800 [Plasmodium ovale wallikeri]|uniref:Uncharacterized protein n=1 Tax=Plasmodium ovale wallikeri TaxID=864142 RepID=A0A1A8YQB9_PLAOA|nr:hypothetical protein POVWA2_016800 [Plasmodium ovale wallikeri]SBT56464.1 hypothetical protein POVWA1_076290 [Plasmodium ovale wallikeri]